MRQRVFITILLFLFTMVLSKLAAQEFCSNQLGVLGEFEYELWIQNGETCVSLGEDGEFQISWGDGAVMDFWMRLNSCNGDGRVHYVIGFHPNGNAWYGAYGRVLEYDKNDSYAEYDEIYIIDGWGSWRPYSGTEIIGTIKSDGESYDVYYSKTNRHMTFITIYFDQYWIVNRRKRSEGVITISNHIEEIAKLGFNESRNQLDFISFTVSAYQSAGKADVSLLNINSNGPTPEVTAIPSQMGDVDSNGKIDIIDALLVAQFYVGMELQVFEEKNADFNQDGIINIVDSLRIAQCYVGSFDCHF